MSGVPLQWFPLVFDELSLDIIFIVFDILVVIGMFGL